jgi:23S rRNA-/tRNA-specific pseudouridylate synthase
VALPPILYEDDFLIAFDKPSGLLIAPDRWDKTRENLMAMIHNKMGHHVANVHRLDADTSGIVLCAKTKPALDYLTGQFQGRTAQKRYLALSVVLPPERAMKLTGPIVERQPDGNLPENFTIDVGLGEDEQQPGRMRVFRKRGGKPSVTEFRILENFGRYLYFECRPITGRTHQIRVHLAAVGAPILNDPFYGDPEERLLLSKLKRGYKGRAEEKPLVARLALHAFELTIKHPHTQEPITIQASVPHEFEVALKYLRKFSR